MKGFVWVLLGLGLVGCTKADEPGLEPDPDEPVPTRADHVFLMELSQTEAQWTDFAYLAAIPASAHLNGGRPAVLAVADYESLPEATLDLLDRMVATDAYVLNESLSLDAVPAVETLTAADASALSAQLAGHWNRSERLVLADGQDYASAVLATSLAARLDAPLLFTAELAAGEREAVESRLGVTETLWVDVTESAASGPDNVTALHHVDEVLAWLNDAGVAVPYVALTNVEDRLGGRSQKASLVASMYTARRDGIVLPLSVQMPTPAVDQGALPEAAQFLHGRYDALGFVPEYLAIVGAHDALPQVRGVSIFDNGMMGHPVTDIPYGQVDEDMFLDVALGRIVADDIYDGSALATRTTTYEQLMDGHWENRFAEAGLWGFDEARQLFRNVGFDEPIHPTESEFSTMGMVDTAAVVHKDHSNCFILGHAFDVDTDVLFAPTVVTSQGCSVAGMDLVSLNQRSIVDHVLGSGAVAFMGASRNAIAENTYIHVSFWNQVLAGATLGEGFRAGINDLIVHWKDENDSAGIRYSIDIEMLYGDPALSMFVPSAPETAPAHATVDGDVVTVTGPEAWTLVQYAESQLEEWNYDEDLYMYVGPGATPRTYWSGRHDSEDLYYSAAVPISGTVSGMEQLTDLSAPLGWNGDVYVDERLDGTQDLRWSVRLLDYDMATGEVRGQVDSASYRIAR